ncbi:MAG: hypothetical protein OQJ96_06945 [Flavobacteriales bacterium]|nr:hypothetical protein [Flavobacteriales bacterium]MCW8913721.1 hypothetical protein [Flavobacteriales bacterium]MCW8937893.1 hypothetical protein [Flavobacteriales bacterium]MCW8941330.1 hypothetical protein [Flavobacteriales bacterium]MCW8967325.1 hypothetical protein [Flavobacteriales bacterium]
MKNILLIVIMFHLGFIVKAQSNNTPKLLYADSINANTAVTNKQKPELLLQDSNLVNAKRKNDYKPEVKLSEGINNNNDNDSTLIKKKEIVIEN